MNKVVKKLVSPQPTYTRWFNVSLFIMTTAFFGLLILVVVVSFNRRSGQTGQDMAQIHLMQHAKPNRTP